MSNTIYLYLKTHNKTGLKYLGKTVQNPFTYRGSGTRWNNHIRKHGYDVTTKILLNTDSNNAISLAGLYYSELWNIVESKEFANIRAETGDGGDTSKFIDYKDPVRRKRISEKAKGRKGNSGSFKKGSDRVKRASKKASARRREMIESGENSHWKNTKGTQTTSTLGHKWYRNVDTGERCMFINKEVPTGWVTSDEYKEMNRKSNKAWYHNNERNFLLDRNDSKIKQLGLVSGRSKF